MTGLSQLEEDVLFFMARYENVWNFFSPCDILGLKSYVEVEYQTLLLQGIISLVVPFHKEYIYRKPLQGVVVDHFLLIWYLLINS